MPPVDPRRLDELDELRRRLCRDVEVPRPWAGRLRRQAHAESVRSSTAIEGFHVTRDQAAALVAGAPAEDAVQQAVAGDAVAMEHVAVLADDPSFRWVDRVVLDLHFDACRTQPGARPGRFRLGPMLVTAPSEAVAYRAPDAEAVPELMNELIHWLETGDLQAHVLLRAAMAHLNLVSIHAFDDGNGRLARILQSLVLARDAVLAPELGSIEPWLAAHTGDYYQALMDVQGGTWAPERDATPWVELCLEAHRAQVLERLALVERAARRWEALEQLVSERGWPDRLVIALEQALAGSVDRGSYMGEAEVATATASTDLRRLVDAGLLGRKGRGPSARYEPTAALRRAVDTFAR